LVAGVSPTTGFSTPVDEDDELAVCEDFAGGGTNRA
jgi:hypothetical protein